MTRKAVNKPELEQVILSHLHAKPACKGVRRVKISRTTSKPSHPANWSVEKIEFGDANETACKGELKLLMAELQQHYTLQ